MEEFQNRSLPAPPNSKLGNLLPEKKIDKLTGPLSDEYKNLPYVQKYIDTYGARASSWNEDLILEIATDMAENAYRKVWAID